MQSATVENQLPRFYQIHLEQDLLEGWLVVKEWGHQGSPGRVKREHYTSKDEAEKAALESRDSQIKRGYRVVFVQGERFPG
ncbi:MAG: WGR domain-containing protein [Gammaproteobacteria bacterium]|nr:WGR domain-containing protein [Gammaproteobacteria bacterium]